jgi:hypothetical protein
MKGTRIAILDEMQTWCHKSNESIYWLHGMGGLGKTAIAASLCQHLDNGSDRVLGGSFFCNCSDSSSVQRCMTTLAWSLAQAWEPFYDGLIQALRNDPRICSKSVDRQARTLLLNPLKLIKVPSSSNKVLVIDALDESDKHISDSRTHIIRALKDLTKLGLPWLKIVITGRAETDIASRISEIDARFLKKRDLTTVPGVETDVKLFCERRLGDVKRRFKHLADLDSWPGQDVTSRIASQAKGSFLWLQIVHTLLVESPNPDVVLQSILTVTEDDDGDESYQRLYRLYQVYGQSPGIHGTENVCL